MSAPLVSNRIYQANCAESIARGVECLMCGEPVADEPGSDIWFNETGDTAYGRCAECSARIENEERQAWQEYEDSLVPAMSAGGPYKIWAGDA
jgi:DNA-directed RNA polymerase subunit RPC12/RpoP